MEKKNNLFLKKLLATFKVEAQEHIKALSSGLIELEKASTAEDQLKIIETIFREAHSLKGAARSVNMTEIEVTCQSLESVFAILKRQEIDLSLQLFDLLHEAVDSLGGLLSAIGAEPTAAEKSRLIELYQRLRDAAEGSGVGGQGSGIRDREPEIGIRGIEATGQPQLTPDTRPPTPGVTETVRVPQARLTSILFKGEELLSAKISAAQRAVELREAQEVFAFWGKEWGKIRPEVQKIRRLLEKKENSHHGSPFDFQFASLLEFLDWNYAYTKALHNKLTTLTTAAEQDTHSLSIMVDNFLEDMKKVMMLPFSTLLEIFPKLIRDLSRDQGKEAELVVRGGEVEIDRRILEEMKDPLIHLVRNCIDHGIEKPEERKQKKKPPQGVVTITVAQKNSSVEILISDDGTGIEVGRIKAAAVRLKMLTPEKAEEMSESELLSLLYYSGFSTSPIITDLSGRGLGLAIVREKVEGIGGIISFESYPDEGTTFRLVLPLTLATFRGIIVRVADHHFVLPTTNVERVLRVSKEEIKTVENRETIELNGQVVSLVRLEDVLEIPPQKVNHNAARIPVVVLASAEKRIAFQVNEILNEQEVLVKSLGKQLSRVQNIAGATVLGTGKVVPILNVPDLMKSAVQVSGAAIKPAFVLREEKEAKRQSILVVEDSITARTLLKNILEAAGYNVVTAVDGIDAFTQLRSGEFDVVVSDVDMPRMNGFDLTARVRGDKKLTDLPVVLVTALDSREDRERGIEVGANAYIVKSSFDQSNLLEVIRRLI